MVNVALWAEPSGGLQRKVIARNLNSSGGGRPSEVEALGLARLAFGAGWWSAAHSKGPSQISGRPDRPARCPLDKGCPKGGSG